MESKEGLKYFGAIQCERLVTKDVVTLLRAYKAWTLIASWGEDPTSELEATARAGSARPVKYYHQPPLEMLRLACRANVAVYKLLGEFDDHEQGCAIIARPQIIDTVFPQSEGVAA